MQHLCAHLLRHRFSTIITKLQLFCVVSSFSLYVIHDDLHDFHHHDPLQIQYLVVESDYGLLTFSCLDFFLASQSHREIIKISHFDHLDLQPLLNPRAALFLLDSYLPMLLL
jgi:hypothetical protein